MPSEAEWAWLEERYPGTPSGKLIDEFEGEFGERIPKSTLYNHMNSRGIKRKLNWLEWTPERIEWIKAYSVGHTKAEVIAEHMRVFGEPMSEAQFKGAYSRFGLRLGTPKGGSSADRVGMVSPMKGMTWDDRNYSPEARERILRTSFKSGGTPHNTLPLGTERVKDGFVYVKVSDKPKAKASELWRPKSHLVWEEANGHPVPQDAMVVFADRDVFNFDPANLVAVPKSLWSVILRNNLEYWDADSLRAAMALAMLKSAAFRAAEDAKRRSR